MRERNDPKATHRRDPNNVPERPLTFCGILLNEVAWFHDVPRNPIQREDFCSECDAESEWRERGTTLRLNPKGSA